MSSTAADLVLHNAQVYTVDNRAPTAEAIAIRDGDFLAVGSSAEVTAAYPDAPRVDVEGRTIIPGFIDAHAHLQELGLSLRRTDLTETSSPSAVVERLKSFADDHDLEADAWLRGHGWDQTDWTPPQFPDRDLLDAAFPNRPVWLRRKDIHAGWANTPALEATVGIDRLKGMSDPDGGHIHREKGGRPTGVLVDDAMALVEHHMPPPTETQKERALGAALRQTARHGITGLHDAGVDLDRIRRYQHFVENDSFPLRVYAMINGGGETFDYFRQRGPLRHPSGRLNVESVKFFADGALGSRGAALLDDYADAPGNRGFLLQPEKEFQEDVQSAVACGFQVNTHAIGDRANRVVLDAYEKAIQSCREPVRRPRIEHAQIVAPEDQHRFGALGIIASVQPAFAPSDMDWAPARLGSNRIDRAYAWRSLLKAGASLAFGSDAPVEPINPIRGFYAAITRQDGDGRPKGGWLPAQRLHRSTALYAYTQGAAYAAFQEDEVGSITPGKRADFVVLSQNLMTVAPSEILDTETVATYIDGAPAYTREDWPKV